MKQEISYNEQDETFEIHITVPRYQSGVNTIESMYDEPNPSTWTADNVCVWIRPSHLEFALSLTQYLDYKDSLQATQPICYFDSQKEAEAFAEKYGLMIEYSRV